MTGIVNYGKAGNIISIKRALEAAGADVQVVEHPGDMAHLERLVVPGVGAFSDGMGELTEKALLEPIREFAAAGKPLLGICLGMQLLADVGFEFDKTAGLGLVPGEVRKIESEHPVPHMGFSALELLESEMPLWRGVGPEDVFYFMHSFEMVNYTDIAALGDYAGHRFVAAVRRGNVFGVQFHPEKSREAGLKILKNFCELGKDS